MEGAGNRVQKELLVLQDIGLFGIVKKGREKAVVWGQEELPGLQEADEITNTAHARINNSKMNSASRKKRSGCCQRTTTSQDRLRWDLVAQVYKLDPWGTAKDNALHNAHVGIMKAKVTGKGNDHM